MVEPMRKLKFAPAAAGIVIILVVALLFGAGLRNLESGGGEVQRQQLEESIRRAALACYASEGYYPPDFEYIEEHYGLRPDPERYAVFYEVHAENLMPEITVVSIER